MPMKLISLKTFYKLKDWESCQNHPSPKNGSYGILIVLHIHRLFWFSFWVLSMYCTV